VYQVELEMQNDELKTWQLELEKERQRFADLFNLAPVSYFILESPSSKASAASLHCPIVGRASRIK